MPDSGPLVVELAEVAAVGTSEPYHVVEGVGTEPGRLFMPLLQDRANPLWASQFGVSGLSSDFWIAQPNDSSAPWHSAEPFVIWGGRIGVLHGGWPRAVAQAYVRLIREFDWVRRVGLNVGGHGVITTVFEATPFDQSFRDPLFDAELKVLAALKPAVSPEFVLVNEAEYRLADSSWEPSFDDEPLFQRS